MINKTFRLFVSSTFNDFLQERAILNESVFFEIDEYCQQRGYNFQLIDLRWGIMNESAINQKTMEICLEEVKRCCSLSPKPNFLLMVGERYGWTPLPNGIFPKEFEKIISAAEEAEAEIIKKWYEFDENEIGGTYYLKPRTGKYISYDTWETEEKSIHTALASCLARMEEVMYETQKMLSTSATEQEIMEGLLSNEDVCDNTIAVFRSGYTEKDSDISKINELKARITERMSEDGCADNILSLKWNDGYSEQFRKRVVAVLKAGIEKEIIRIENSKNEIDKISVVHQQYLSPYVVINRSLYLDKIASYIKGDNVKPLFVVGDSGCGKTTLLAELIEQDFDADVFFAFYALDESSYSYIDCLKSISNTVCEKYGLSNTLDITEFNLTESLYDLIALIPDEKNAVIIIDGLDMFQDIGDIHESLFPDNLPRNIKIVISCATGKIADCFLGNGILLSLGEFTEDESIEYLRSSLKQKNRVIASENQNRIIAKAIKNGAAPLYLKIVSDICAAWRSSEAVKDLPVSADEIALQYLENMFNKFGHNRELVLYALALIVSTPYGITEEELQLLLLNFSEVREFFMSEDRYKHDMTRLPFVVWSRLFYDLKGCLTLIKDRDYIVVRFAHNVFKRVFVKKYSEYVESARQLLAHYYTCQNNTLADSQFPNVRKILGLIYLLKEMNKLREMADLLTDLSFVDAAVKTGDIDGLIKDYDYLIIRTEEISSEKNRLYRIYLCLREHRKMLSCYADEFYTCAAECGLTNIKSVFTLQKEREKTVNNSDLIFPYSSSSKIEWNKNAGKYAVFYKSYVYICDVATGIELCRVFVPPKQFAFQNNILRVLWINDFTIAAAVENCDIYFFDVSNELPKAIDKIETEYSEEDDIKIIAKYNLLLFKHEKQILAYEVKKGQKIKNVYSVDVPHNVARFDIVGDEIFYRCCLKSIAVCSAENGKQTGKIKLANNLDALAQSELYRINENAWLELRGTSAYIYDVSSKSKKELVIPFSKNNIELSEGHKLVGRKKILFYEDNIILLVDLESYSLRYYKCDTVKSIAWVHEDFEISIVSYDGLNRIKIDEFENLPEGPERMLVLTKNRFDFSSIIAAFSVMPQLFSSFVRINKNHYLDYDMFFFSANDMLRNNVAGTIIETSKFGTKAIVFEEKNIIAIYNKENKLISLIENLSLKIDSNSVLKIEFIENYEYLLVWCNLYLKIYDVFSGKVLLSLNLNKKPLLAVKVNEATDTVLLTFYNNQEITINPAKISRSVKRMMPIGNNEARYTGPYYSYETDGRIKIKRMLDLSQLDNIKVWHTNAARMIKDTFVYRSENCQLLYEDGCYSIFPGKEKFDSNLKSFPESELIEQAGDESSLKGFLRRKNDLFSKLYEFDGGYLVLVARALNSLVAFDVKEMKVLSAYKINGNIIGSIRDGNDITLTLDRSPYQMRFTVSL